MNLTYELGRVGVETLEPATGLIVATATIPVPTLSTTPNIGCSFNRGTVAEESTSLHP